METVRATATRRNLPATSCVLSPLGRYGSASLPRGRWAFIPDARSVGGQPETAARERGNMLTTLGAAPAIASAQTAPSYPCALPGNVQADLIVGLGPLSKDLVVKTLQQIERPNFEPLPKVTPNRSRRSARFTRRSRTRSTPCPRRT